MTEKTAIIIGAGFVGGTAYRAFVNLANWRVGAIDKNQKNSYLAKQDLNVNWLSEKDISSADLVFVAVPTPMIKKTGECHTGIVESVVKSVRTLNTYCTICIKSTVPPGTTHSLNEKYGRVVFNPEFLTEDNAFRDFIDLPYQIIGYSEIMPGIFDSLEDPVEQIYKDAFEQGLVAGGERIISMSSTQAEMVKYTRNCYLAVRLSYFNEIKQICDKLDIDYDNMKYFAGLDSRVGNHYNRVESSNPGWSKSCLPKDLNALKALSYRIGVNPTMLVSAWQKNLEVRKDRDWERMEKAVVDIKENE